MAMAQSVPRSQKTPHILLLHVLFKGSINFGYINVPYTFITWFHNDIINVGNLVPS